MSLLPPFLFPSLLFLSSLPLSLSPHHASLLSFLHSLLLLFILQQGRTHTFELSDTGGSSLGLPLSQQSLTASMGSPSSQGLSLGLPPYAYHDGSMSSSQSISSSNSGRHSDNGLEEDLEQPEK